MLGDFRRAELDWEVTWRGWLDVDCIVHGDLSPLADIRGDVAFRMHSKFRRHHKGARFRAQSGTMVFRPTPGPANLLNAGNGLLRVPRTGDRPVVAGRCCGGVDRHDVRTSAAIYCVNPDEKGKVLGVVVQHDSAVVHFPKVSGWRRYVRRMMRRQAA